MGPGYTIEDVSAGDTELVRFQRLQEFAGNLIVKAVLAGTEPGDTGAMQSRLFSIIPGYIEATTSSRLKALSRGLLRK
jgi:hypothetical protein